MEPVWLGRYREGYVTADGGSFVLSDELRTNHGWASPEGAVLTWTARGDFEDPSVSHFENGKMQVDDVRARPEFAKLGVVSTWRSITFVLRQESAH